MREYFKLHAVKSIAGVAIVGGLAALIQFTSKPGQALERPSFRVFGYAKVIDGDTLDVGGARVRLEGIDAPELGQSCPGRWWGTWASGRDAAKRLRQMVAGKSVTCTSRGYDKYGRMLGICSVAGHEINRELVNQGLAWAFVKYSRSYVAEERAARAAGRGIWRSTCRPAWKYRHARWSGSAARSPEGCAIKGNITARGQRVYHVPWGRWYERTRIEIAKGERWFCNEADAINAGWRPSAS